MDMLLLIAICFLLAGGVVGFLWRWSYRCLALAAFGLGIVLFVAFRGWSDLDFAAVIRNSSAIMSWLVMLPFEAVWVVVPVFVGTLTGWHIRRSFCTRDTRG